MTPASVKAFAKYFSSDLIMKAYGLPAALGPSCELLVGALFHR